MDLSIEGFWKKRLNSSLSQSTPSTPGWSFVSQAVDSFVEPQLSRSAEFEENDIENASVILVSAPGAVGKSALAQQLAYETDSLYFDLSKAEPVGANTLSGGLLKCRLHEEWDKDRLAVLIDGLDEARLRVRQDGFSAFLGDIAEMSRDRDVPTVLMGRTNAAIDTWLILQDFDVAVGVVEIEFFDHEKALDFAFSQLSKLGSDSSHDGPKREALKLILASLSRETEGDGQRFAGYAPVLQAISRQVHRESNIAEFNANLMRGDKPITLLDVVHEILDREHDKLSPLKFNDPSLHERLYLREEQLDRLAARIYGSPPPGLPDMESEDAENYGNALQEWVEDHPFIEAGNYPSTSVFEAAIVSHALKNNDLSVSALNNELTKGAASNPFLSEFYIRSNRADDVTVEIPADHIGIIYASMRARLSLGDSASLLVEGNLENADDDLETLRTDVEITVARRDEEQPRVISFVSDQTAPIRLGPYVEDVEINAPFSVVEIGPSEDASLMPPVNIQCQILRLNVDRVIVDAPKDKGAAAVYLQAENYEGARMHSVPIVRSDSSLTVTWPNAQAHPWTSFAIEPPQFEDPRTDEALRRLRKFVTAFRANKNGELARFRAKIDHARMTKGTGQQVLNQLIKDDVISIEGKRYILNPSNLGAIVGVSYEDCMSWNFGEKAFLFVNSALG